MRIGLIYGGCGSAAVAARNLGQEIIFNFEPRGQHFLDTFEKNFGSFRRSHEAVYVVEVPEHGKLQTDIFIGQPDCKMYSALRTRKKENTPIEHTQLHDFLVRVVQNTEVDEDKAFIVENLPKGMDALMEYIELKSPYDPLLSRGRKPDGSFCKMLSDFNLTRVNINAKNYLPQSRRRSFLIGTPKISTKNFEFLSASPDLNPTTFLITSSRNLIKDLEDEDAYEIFNNHKAARHSEERIKGFSKLGPGISYYGTQNNRRLDPNKPAYTITSHCTQHVHYKLNRTLTVRECARFMGFPDSFVFMGPTTKQLDQVGKAIVVPVIQDLLSQLVVYLESNLKKDK